jgi:hypothetical protein
MIDRRLRSAGDPPPDSCTTELIGLAEDGRLILWRTGKVEPAKHFELSDGGRRIKEGLHVLDWDGHHITAHCTNFAGGNVAVLLMCSKGEAQPFPRAEIEQKLVGKVIEPSESMWAIKVRGRDAPARQRGRV